MNAIPVLEFHAVVAADEGSYLVVAGGSLSPGDIESAFPPGADFHFGVRGMSRGAVIDTHDLDDDGRIDVYAMYLSEPPSDRLVGLWAKKWGAGAGVDISSPAALEVRSLEDELIGVVTPGPGNFRLQVFGRVLPTRALGGGEAREQHMLVIWMQDVASTSANATADRG